MFEQFGFEDLTPQLASVYFALMIGAAFGILAQITRFCIRRGLVGETQERRSALGLWMVALAAAIIGTQASIATGWIDFAEHRFFVSDIPVFAIVIGGLAFGAGMVLTRGCVSRLTVLSGTGNLRALTVLIVFAVIAHATLRGVLAPVRVWVSSFTTDLGVTSLADLPGGMAVWSLVALGIAAYFIARARLPLSQLVLGALIGLLVPAAWVGTGLVLFDEFDPIAMTSLSFTAPAAETIFWTLASTAIPAGFGVGFFGGVILGAASAALLRGEFQWQSFETPQQTLRYGAGAVLMGIGGVIAGGCTVGAGLAGVPTLSIAAIIALLSIIAGALLMNQLLSSRVSSGLAVPAE